MLSRQEKEGSVYAQSNEKNAYNQRVDDWIYQKNVRISITLNKQSNVDDARFKDAEYVGITSDKALNDTMKIKVDGIDYKIVLCDVNHRRAVYYLKVIT